MTFTYEDGWGKIRMPPFIDLAFGASNESNYKWILGKMAGLKKSSASFGGSNSNRDTIRK
jgi:hypothetical protein